MDALLTTFLAALIAEQGDPSQLLALAAVARFGPRAPVLAALALAAFMNAAISAAAGAAIHLLVPYRATLLLVALALLSAGGGALLRARTPKVTLYDTLGPFAASFVAAFVLGFGDKTQFLTLALAARSDAPVLAAIGAGAGVCVGTLPVLAMGRDWPLRALRHAVAAVFLLAGLVVALAGLRLI